MFDLNLLNFCKTCLCLYRIILGLRFRCKVDSEIADAEIKLQQLKTRQLQLKKGALLVLKHLQKEAPLAVKRQDYIVVVSNENVSIERNVL